MIDRAEIERDRVPVVECIETVTYENGYEEPSDPIWRVRIGEYCADFEVEQAARNFCGAILALLDERDRGGWRPISTPSALTGGEGDG